MIDIQRLKELARELRGLEWMPPTVAINDGGGRYNEILTSEGDAVIGEFCGPNDDEAAFIAAANPAVILSLIEQVEGSSKEKPTEPLDYFRGCPICGKLTAHNHSLMEFMTNEAANLCAHRGVSNLADLFESPAKPWNPWPASETVVEKFHFAKPSFKSTGKFDIHGRGTVFTTTNPYECDDFSHLIGKQVLIDGVLHTVKAVESSAKGGPKRKGESIGLLVDSPWPAPVKPYANADSGLYGEEYQGQPEAPVPSEGQAIPTGLSSAAIDVLAERQRQKDVEGWTPEHDDQYENDQLSLAAACYALASNTAPKAGIPGMWPWPENWWKPTTERRNLEKAGALILAEIERLDRDALAKKGQP